jgi:hypothetical protein
MNSRETVSDGMRIPGCCYSHDFSSWTVLLKGEWKVNSVWVPKRGPVVFVKMISVNDKHLWKGHVATH